MHGITLSKGFERTEEYLNKQIEKYAGSMYWSIFRALLVKNELTSRLK